MLAVGFAGAWAPGHSAGAHIIPTGMAVRAAVSHATMRQTGITASSRTIAAIRTSYSHLPLAFESAAGHGVTGVKFLARGNGYTVYLTANDAVLSLGALAPSVPSARRAHALAHSALLRFRLLGANPRPQVVGADRQQATVNYFSGADPLAWQRGIPTYAQVSYAQIYAGVDLRYYGTQGQLEYDFRLAPYARAQRIRQQVGGVRGLRVTANGDLLLDALGGGQVRWARPVAYQIVPNGLRRPVSVRYRLLGSRTFGFALGHFDHALPLVIDPVLSYSTFFGNNDVATGIAIDRAGAAYITGFTFSTIITATRMLQLTHVPTLCPANSSTPCSDAFVAKLSGDNHKLVYSTFLGGGGNDVATAIAVDNSGSAYVAGYTNSGSLSPSPAVSPPSFPVTAHAFQKVNRGGNDAFVAKLSPNGQSLLYSTYLGGSTDNANTMGDDGASGIAVDRRGDAYVTGYTYAYNFPLKNPLQGSLGYGKGTLGTQVDAFVSKLNPSGSSLVYSTYLGGSGSDMASGIAVDRGGNAYITGQTNSPDFPTPPHALQAHLYGTDFNSFVAKLNTWGSALIYATYLGHAAGDKTHGIAVDNAGNAYVVGETTGGMPRTVGVAQPTSGGGIDAFVAKLSDHGVLIYSTYLGGIGDDIGNAIALDPAGDAYVTGSTASAAFNTPVFPLKGALQGALGGNRGGFGMLDAFVAKVNSCGSQLLYSSYLGGTFVDGGQAIAVDGHGNAYIAGQTLSPNFPLSRPVLGGAGYMPPAANAFVAKISGSPGSRRGICPMALTLDVLPQASSTSPLTVTVHTSPHARVTVTLEVTNTVPPPTTAPAPGAPKPPKLGALLYRISMHGAADSYGLYQGILPLKYTITAPVTGNVRVRAVQGRAAVAANTPIQLVP